MGSDWVQFVRSVEEGRGMGGGGRHHRSGRRRVLVAAGAGATHGAKGMGEGGERRSRALLIFPGDESRERIGETGEDREGNQP